MTDTDVRDALERSTRHLAPAAGLLDDVRRAGRARVIRRRGVLAAGLGVLGATAAGALLPSSPGSHPTGASPFDGPTGGDLAGDRGYLRAVLAAWHAYIPAHPAGQDPYGEPHVVWAGATPAGPAAFVVQRQRPAGSADLVVGLVTGAGGGVAVVDQNVWRPRQGVSYSHAHLLGAERDVLLLRDGGVPVRFSTRVRHRSDGRIERAFQPVPFTDGAAVLRVPSQRERVTVALVTGPVTDPEAVYLANVHDLRTRAGHPLVDGSTMGSFLPGIEAAWPPDGTDVIEAAEKAWAGAVLLPYLDTGGYQPFSASPNLHLRGATPDGRRLLVRTEVITNGTGRVLLVWGRPEATPQVRYAGVRDMSGPLQLSLRLPERQGVVVATPNASLRYRIGTGSWVTAATWAALLPDAATEVEVTPPDGHPRRVPVR